MIEDLKRYQWIKGEEIGTVEEVLKEDENKFFVFKSGRKCNTTLINEFMIPINYEEEILSFTDVQQPAKVVAAKQNAKVKAIQKPAPENPIIPLLDKSKKSKVGLMMLYDLKLPSKEFISVLQDSWDEDIVEILSKYLVEQIEDPKEFLTTRFKSSLTQHFLGLEPKKSG